MGALSDRPGSGEIGAFDEALKIARTANEQADARQVRYALPQYALAYTHFRRGDPVRPVLEQGLALAKETNRLMVPPYLAALGTANVREWRVSEGIALLEEAIAETKVTNRAQQALFLSQLSAAYLAAGRRDDALRTAREGLCGARQRQERGDEAWNLRELAEALASGDGVEADQAAHQYVDALSLANNLGMRPLVAHCHLGLGKLYHRTGKREQAQERLATATTMYRDMGMTYWLGQVAKQLEAPA